MCDQIRGCAQALKELDTVSFYHNPETLDIDSVNFCVALGLFTTNSQLQSSSNAYSTGCAQAWACLLHFQVIDLLLARDYTNLTEPAIVLSLNDCSLIKLTQGSKVKPCGVERIQQPSAPAEQK
ncbi:hypothetical protein DFH09DRAFT_1081073 [Mycena vulgaris]|nr:hypothetical protein DFH09DRAFT_1081073 [Mycena vulgaris]